jgi:hypothetical protein
MRERGPRGWIDRRVAVRTPLGMSVLSTYSERIDGLCDARRTDTHLAVESVLSECSTVRHTSAESLANVRRTDERANLI